ncbi:MAG: hypothetical protein LBI78_05745 [Campylobacteraceae bacterium]|jgi:thiol:disulfide interchange protein DsbC|nr:hypothetical protein [Campylobacteraceae bacterium]
MRKLLLCLALIGGFTVVSCDDIKKVLTDSAKSVFKEDFEIVSVNKLKSIEGLSVVIFKSKEGQAIPLYASNDGKSFLPVPNYYYFSNQEDFTLLSKIFEDVENINKQAVSKNVDALFASLPKEAFVLINSKEKTDNLLTIVTDPDCPYCRNELKGIKDRLKTSHIRMVFAPVHDEKAFIKSALILEETKKLKPSDTDKIIAVFEKYYQDVDVSDNTIDTKFVHENADEIFKSGFIRAVPYLHEGKLK